MFISIYELKFKIVTNCCLFFPRTSFYFANALLLPSQAKVTSCFPVLPTYFSNRTKNSLISGDQIKACYFPLSSTCALWTFLLMNSLCWIVQKLYRLKIISLNLAIFDRKQSAGATAQCWVGLSVLLIILLW